MRDALLSDLLDRVRDFREDGSFQRVLDAQGPVVVAELLRLVATDVIDRESVDTDALYAAAVYHHVRSIAWQSLAASAELEVEAGLGEDPRGRTEADFAAALHLYGLLFLADHRRVPRELWPDVIRETGHDPWRDPLDHAADLIIDGEESGDFASVNEAIALLRTLDGPSDADSREVLLGHALLLCSKATDAPAARRRADANAAVEILTRAAARAEPAIGRRSARRSSLGDAHRARFALTQDPTDLLAAESAYRAALVGVAADSDEYAHACAGIGTAFGQRAEVALGAGQWAAPLLREAVDWLRRAVDGNSPRINDLALAGLRRVTALWIRENARVARTAGETESVDARAAPERDSDRSAEWADEADIRGACALVQLSEQVGARVLPKAEALRRVIDPAFVLSDAAIDLVVSTALARQSSDATRDIVFLLRLTLEAAESRWGATRDTPWWTVADAYVEAVRHSLAENPNGGALADAHAVVARQIMLLQVDAFLDPDDLSGSLFAAGLLHLTPYLMHTSGLSFDGAYGLWMARQRRQAMAHPDGPEVDPSPLPSPMAAAEQSIGYLQQAADLARGHQRGRVLRALAEAQSFLAELRRESADEQIRLICREALDFLDPVLDPVGYLYLLRILHRFGEVYLPDSLDDLLPMPLATMRDRSGLREASSAFAEALALAGEAMRPDLEAELLEVADEDLPRLWSDAQRRQRWMSEVHLLGDGQLLCSPALRGISDLVEQARALAADEGWSRTQLAATLIHLAAHSPVDGAHQLGRDLVAEAHEAAPQLWDLHHDAIEYLDAGLAYDSAMRASSAGAHADAACEFSTAAVLYAHSGQLDLALHSIDAGVQDVFACDDTTVGRAANMVVHALAGLGAGLDESVAWALHEIYRRLLFRLVRARMDVAAVAALHQAAKGRAFSLALHSAGPLTLTRRLLRDLQQVLADEVLLPGPLPEVELPGGAETAMVCYAGSGEAEDEIDDDAVHRNRQRAVDRRVSEQLTAAHSPWQLPLLALDEMQALLPPETVLVSLVLSEGREKAGGHPVAALYGLAITRDGVEHRSLLFPQFDGSLIRASRGSHHLALSPFALRIADLRRAITADPLHRVVTRDAQRELAERPNPFLAGFDARVSHWYAEGRRHLCVWADGPLHYVPFHLLCAGNGALADDWTVTQIASAGMLGGRRPSARRRFVAFAAAAGGIRHGLPVEDALEIHATQVAAAMAGEAVLGAAATRQRFLAALADARYVHVAAHGTHNEWAPWFQCLYLSPGADDDGRVFAHDILQADLRGVDLVTLSACESALGRFDLNDNLRGLPAALLSAGAAAVIGCLWPVHPRVATDFFGHLYQSLAVNPDRRSAFRDAQRTTRDRHPAYRDWGAFVFIGDWRTSAA